MAQPPKFKWTPVPNATDAEIADARVAAHYAVQWLGRFGRAFGKPVADDSHTSLRWDLETGAFANGDSERGLSLSLNTLSFSIHSRGARQSSFPIDGRTDKDVRAWLGEEAKQLGLDPSALDAPLPYEMPGSSLANGSAYDISAMANGISFLETLYSNAAQLLKAVKDADDRALPIRCWPHHFDIATLIAVEEQTSENSRSIGVGMSPGDDNYPTPYLYITPWPYPDAQKLTALPAPGHWHTDGWIGAILKIQDLTSTNDANNAVSSFVSAALSQANALLDGA